MRTMVYGPSTKKYATMVYRPSTMDLKHLAKHEIIKCERCGASMECKANAFTKCQCSTVPLNLNEVQYISENYEGCMCAGCLVQLKEEFRLSLNLP